MVERARRAESADDFSPLGIGKNFNPQQFASMVGNIERRFREATPEQVREGLAWYPGAHDLARGEIGRGNVTQGAGIIAALSPGKKYDPVNVALAREIVRPENYDKLRELQRVQRQTQAMEFAGLTPKARNTERSRILSASHDELFGGPTEKGQITLKHQSAPNVLKAFDIMEGRDPREVLPMKLKTGHFFRNIENPEDPDPVTIDTVAHDVAIDRRMPWKIERGLSTPGRYNIFWEGYQQAAKRVGEIPGNVQAVTWVNRP